MGGGNWERDVERGNPRFIYNNKKRQPPYLTIKAIVLCLKRQ